MTDELSPIEFASTDVIAWEFDWATSRFIYISDSVEKIFGYPISKWYEPNFWPTTIHPDDYESVLGFCKLQTESLRDHEFRYRMIRADGSIAWIHDVVTITNEEGQGNLILRGVFFDVTAYHQREEALLLARKTAEAASRAKTEFLGVLSHELRTPLNPILGFSEILLEDNLTETQQEYVEAIQSSAQRQLSLIDALLEYARLDRESVSIKNLPFNVLRTCKQLLKEAKHLNTTNLLYLESYTENGYKPVDAGGLLVTDKRMLEQILSNLLTNAAKYTQNGTITLRVGQKSTSSGSSYFFGIEDTGIGIPEDKCPNLFEPFNQVDSSYGRINEGIGLGLSIAKKLIGILDGEIGFKSQLGKGSFFWFSIPSYTADRSALEKSPESCPETSEEMSPENSQPRPRSLIIEDDELNRLMLTKILTKVKHDVTTAETAESALEACRNQSYDYIFLDLSLPKMDGFEFYEALNKENLNASGASVIATTAHTETAVKTKCFSLGMEAFVAKPMTPSDISRTLETLEAQS